MPHKSAPSTLRIAILINTSRRASFSPSIRDSFTTSIAAVAPKASINFYDPIESQSYPDPSQYDLIILSGGTADLNAPDPWVLKMLEFVRAFEANSEVKCKLLGICWGHQAIHVALGGHLSMMLEPELGVTPIALTPEGVSFFDFASDKAELSIHEFHRREITHPVSGFTRLLTDNQAFLSEDDRILTFQGHPEMNEKLAKALLADAPAYMGSLSAERVGEVRERMEGAHDGGEIWGRVVEWVLEK